MTEATQALLPVTQADRDAVAAYWMPSPEEEVDHLPWVRRANAAKQGQMDDDDLIQAFASHRISHSLPGDVGMREPWPGCFSDLQRRRVTTLAKLGLMLSVMESGETAPVEIAEFSVSELYAEVLMALAIEDADDTDMALEEVRDYPDCDIMANQAAFEARAALTPSALSPEPVQKVHELPEGHRWCRHCEQKDPHCSVCEGVGYLPNTDPSALSGDAGEGE